MARMAAAIETYSDIGQVFPPRDEWDVLAYGASETMAGYHECDGSAPFPGSNRTPAYRWGWANRIRDRTLAPDEFEDIRRAVLLRTRACL